MNSRALLALVGAALFLTGCMTERELYRTNALTREQLMLAIGEVKRQVLVYQNYVGYLRKHPLDDAALQAAKDEGFECGKGAIDFDITSVAFELAVTNSATAGGGLGVTALPIGPALAPTGSVTAGVTANRATESIQQLTFFTYPLDPKPANKKPYIDDSPIAVAIMNLRDAMILSATHEGACMVNYNYKDPKANPEPSFKLAIKVTQTAGSNVAISLAVVNVTANAGQTTSTGNAITVKFKQRVGTQSNPNDGVLFAPPVPEVPVNDCPTPDCTGVFNIEPASM